MSTAINRAREEWLIESKAQIASGADQPAQPQRSEQQEWTPQMLSRLFDQECSPEEAIKRICALHNTELAAERKRREPLVDLLQRALEAVNEYTDEESTDIFYGELRAEIENALSKEGK